MGNLIRLTIALFVLMFAYAGKELAMEIVHVMKPESPVPCGKWHPKPYIKVGETIMTERGYTIFKGVVFLGFATCFLSSLTSWYLASLIPSLIVLVFLAFFYKWGDDGWLFKKI